MFLFCFLGMVLYANEVETKETKITRDKKLTTTYIHTLNVWVSAPPSTKENHWIYSIEVECNNCKSYPVILKSLVAESSIK